MALCIISTSYCYENIQVIHRKKQRLRGEAIVPSPPPKYTPLDGRENYVKHSAVEIINAFRIGTRVHVMMKIKRYVGWFFSSNMFISGKKHCQVCLAISYDKLRA